MSRRIKIPIDEKIRITELYLRHKISRNQAATECGVHNSTITLWARLYESGGPAALQERGPNSTYTKELKIAAVTDYLNGKGSMNDICKKYQIRSHESLQQWIKLYNNHEVLKEETGGSFMKKTRNTTYQERLDIVLACLAQDRNYGAIALKYDVSYQQVRGWVKKYEEMGNAGLEDRRGCRIGSQPSRTKEEEMRDEIARLVQQNKALQMENDLLKKVRELERRDRSV